MKPTDMPEDAPAKSPESYLGYLVNRLGHVMQLRFEAALAEVGLTVRQFGVLNHLRSAPGISSAELARRVFVTPQSMADLVASLEEAGLVERGADPGPGRPVRLRITRRGRRVLDRAIEIADALQEHATAELTPEEVAELRRLLQRVFERMCPSQDGGG